jgi:hypothetical protein
VNLEIKKRTRSLSIHTSDVTWSCEVCLNLNAELFRNMLHRICAQIATVTRHSSNELIRRADIWLTNVVLAICSYAVVGKQLVNTSIYFSYHRPFKQLRLLLLSTYRFPLLLTFDLWNRSLLPGDLCDAATTVLPDPRDAAAMPRCGGILLLRGI